MTDQPGVGATRRAVLAAGGLGLLGSAAGRAAWAGGLLTVPQVDRLSLQVITDSATFGPFLENLDLPGLQVMRAGNGGPRHAARMSARTLMGEFGLSVLGQSWRGDERRGVLVDFGYTAEVLANNLALLGVDPAGIHAAVLSHGHLDHYGGFAGLFGAEARGRRRLPLIVGGEETFCERVAQIGDPPPVIGALDRSALKRAGYEVRITAQPVVVAGHAFTTGMIPMSGFERAAIPTTMRPGVGCERALLAPSKRGLAEIADDGEHELATCYAVMGLGLVVVASCSHRGVLNSIRRAQAVSGIDKVHAVVGGFHLVRPRTEAEARRTVEQLARIDPTYVVPMHCTGEVFIAEAMRVMPQKIVRPYVGTRLVFGVAGKA